MNLLSGNRLQSLFECLDQVRPRSRLEASQDGLDLRPDQFNRIEVRRVRGQIDQVSTARADQLFQPSDLVSGQIVHEQNITGLEGGNNTLLDITIKDRTIDRARQHQRRGDPGPAHHRQSRGLWSRGLGHTVHHALIGGGAAIQACQIDIYAGFIQKLKVFHLQLTHLFSKLAALAFHSRSVPLAGMERIFFRGNFSRTNSRCIMLGADLIFVSFSTASHSSCKVASGWAFTAARMATSALANLRDGPPACGSAAQVPISRWRANQRSMEGSLTLYRLAACGMLHSPLSTLATTRSRRSFEYAFILPIMPSNHQDFALGSRKDVLDQAHLAEAISFLVWDPATGTIDMGVPNASSTLRIEKFSDTLFPHYLNRYKGLPPHGEE